MGISGNFNAIPETPRRATYDSKVVRIIGKEREDLIARLMKDAKNSTGQLIKKGMTQEEAEREVTRREVAATNKLAA